MDSQSPPPPADPDLRLQREIHLVAAETLRASLPPPIDDTPEARARYARVAMATVAAMVPGNPMEADLAACHVAAVAHFKDCLRQASEHVTDLKQAKQLRAQAASMGREARGFLGKFERMQAVRQKREANDETRESAAWTEHSFLGLMTQALDSLPPPPPPAPPAPPAAPPPARGAAAPAPPPETMRVRDYEEWSDEEKRQDRVRWQADRYAILHTERVKLIRQRGGLPPDCDFEPPPPEVLHEIIHGNGSNLRWADTYKPYVMPDT
jgi:hypothetical protein